MEIDVLLSRWEAAQQAGARSELAFGRALSLYLMGKGPAPSAELAMDAAAARTCARECLSSVYRSLQRFREAVPLL